jgi:hypothetical protein
MALSPELEVKKVSSKSSKSTRIAGTVTTRGSSTVKERKIVFSCHILFRFIVFLNLFVLKVTCATAHPVAS